MFFFLVYVLVELRIEVVISVSNDRISSTFDLISTIPRRMLEYYKINTNLARYLKTNFDIVFNKY